MITPAFRIYAIRGELTLLCLICDTFSAYPEDVTQRYCWRCNRFLDEVPEDFRREPPALPRPRKKQANG